MTSTATAVLRGFFNDALACTRCGSENVFPAPGPFGGLGAFIGIERHLCRPCGRSFWTKANAEYASPREPEADLGDFGALLAEVAEPPALDFDVTHPEPEPVDLAALDAEFARRCAAASHPAAAERTGRRRRRRGRAAAKA